ncbi:MAG: carboxypeptidase-like regulatory domain-containing protein [Planctomycetota bacterium]
MLERSLERAAMGSADAENRTPRSLRVRVRSRDGLPAGGIPVALLEDIAGRAELSRAVLVSDASSGLVSFDISELAAFSDSAPLAESVSASYRLVARIAAVQRPTLPVPVPLPEGAELELIVPRLGDVLVRVVMADGRPFPGPGTVDLMSVSPSIDEARLATAELVGSLARFRLVEADGLVQAVVRANGRVPSPSRVAGPVAANGTLEIETGWGERLPRIAMTLSDTDGAPLVNSRVVASSVDSRTGLWSGRLLPRADVRTDAEGRLEVDWPESEANQYLKLRVVNASGHDDGRFALVSLDPSPVPGQRVDLGIIRLNGPVTVLSGRVVDGFGEPIADASVWVTTRERWTRMISTKSSADGSFQIQHTRLPGRMYTVAQAPGFERTLLEDVVPGTTGLQIALPADDEAADRSLGQVVVDLLLPARANASYLYFEATSTTGESLVREIPADTSREFLLAKIPPGEWTFTLRCCVSGTEFLSVSGVQVGNESSLRDARLLSVDLRASLRPVCLQVVGENGRPIEEMVDVLLPGRRERVRTRVRAGGRLDFSVEPSVGELTVVLTDDRRGRATLPADGRRTQIVCR